MSGRSPTLTWALSSYNYLPPGLTLASNGAISGTPTATGQFFFSDALTDAVYRQSPYNTRGSRDTRNAADSIYRNGGSRSILKVTKTSSGYRAGITMGVHRG